MDLVYSRNRTTFAQSKNKKKYVESKIIIPTEGVVIGSRTLEEYRLQVLNFMNMLYDNIDKPNCRTCMTPSVVHHNLKFEIGRVEEGESKPFKSKYLVDSIYQYIKDGLYPKARKEWYELLDKLTEQYRLQYELNEERL